VPIYKKEVKSRVMLFSGISCNMGLQNYTEASE